MILLRKLKIWYERFWPIKTEGFCHTTAFRVTRTCNMEKQGVVLYYISHWVIDSTLLMSVWKGAMHTNTAPMHTQTKHTHPQPPSCGTTLNHSHRQQWSRIWLCVLYQHRGTDVLDYGILLQFTVTGFYWCHWFTESLSQRCGCSIINYLSLSLPVSLSVCLSLS